MSGGEVPGEFSFEPEPQERRTLGRKKGDRLRLFVAAYPPEGARGSLLGELEGLELPPHRVMPPEQLHVTLQFVGSVDAAEVGDVEESVGRACAGLGAFEVTPERVVALPARGPKKLVAVETDVPGTLLELHRRLAMRLARRPTADPAAGYVPHLTLCRFRRPSAGVSVDRAAGTGGFVVDRVWLMRSVLHPEGAEHRELGVWTLNG